MAMCPKCKTTNYSDLELRSKATYGHGDSTVVCYVECRKCGARGKDICEWGTIPSREAQREAWKFFEKEVI